MSLEDVAKILQAVSHSLNATPRNEYEAASRYTTNLERLADAQKRLDGFSGSYPSELRTQLTTLQDQVEAHRTLATPALGGAFALDFADAEDNNEAEIAAAEHALQSDEMKRKAKKGIKKSSKKTTSKQDAEDDRRVPPGLGEADVPAEATTPVPLTVVDSTEDGGLATWVPLQSMNELARFASSEYCDISPAVLGGRAECRLIANSPYAVLVFTTPVEFDGTPCQYAVELPRFVVLVLAKGALKEHPALSVWLPAKASGSSSAEASDAEQDGLDSESTDVLETGDYSNLTQLSEQLINEYDVSKDEADESDNTVAGIPRELSAKMMAPLRSVTSAVWVVLMCHGGYFAGGVFQDGQCHTHKSFERYVVRKKQGGRQSTNAKDGGGSYNSIGSQIRAAQEVKWRLEVRSLLYEWRRFIEASSFILYVAPGPQNRSVLSDFSLLPPSRAQGESGPSPISFKDPRVHKAPITTHRPSFSEVQRVFDAVSRCSIVYGCVE